MGDFVLRFLVFPACLFDLRQHVVDKQGSLKGKAGEELTVWVGVEWHSKGSKEGSSTFWAEVKQVNQVLEGAKLG